MTVSVFKLQLLTTGNAVNSHDEEEGGGIANQMNLKRKDFWFKWTACGDIVAIFSYTNPL